MHVFAEQLARHRPEPIVVHEHFRADPNSDRLEGLRSAYQFLFGPPINEAVTTPATAIYAHPKRLGVFTDEPDIAISSIAQSAYAFELQSAPAKDFAPIFKKAGRTGRPARDESRWQATVRLDVEQSFAKLASQGIETPEERGEAEALEFLKRALQSTEDAG